MLVGACKQNAHGIGEGHCSVFSWLSELWLRNELWSPAISDVFKSIYDFLKDWQTLITGLIAIYAARLIVTVMREQISQPDKTEENRRSSESYAARAILPLALSSLCGCEAEYMKAPPLIAL